MREAGNEGGEVRNRGCERCAECAGAERGMRSVRSVEGVRGGRMGVRMRGVKSERMCVVWGKWERMLGMRESYLTACRV